MKILQLIKDLEAIKDLHGDLDCYYHDETGLSSFVCVWTNQHMIKTGKIKTDKRLLLFCKERGAI